MDIAAKHGISWNLVYKIGNQGAIAPDRSSYTPPQPLEVHAAIIADLNAGLLSYSRLAEKYGMSKPGISHIAAKAGISRKAEKKPPEVKIVHIATRPACGYSADTEVFTSEGWKFFPDLNGGETVATRSSAGRFEWQRLAALAARPYEGPMLHFRSQVFDLLVVPDHPLLMERRYQAVSPGLTQREVQKARWVAGKPYRGDNWRIPLTSVWDGAAPDVIVVPAARPVRGRHHPAQRLEIPARTWMRFLGWYVSEGSLCVSMPNQVTISQLRTEHFAEIGETLTEMGVRWRKASTGFQFNHGPLAAWLRASCYTGGIYRAWHKRLPEGVKDYPPALLEELFGAMMRGDGHTEKNGFRRYGTTSCQLADDAVEILQKSGSQGWIETIPVPRGRSVVNGRPIVGRRPQYRVAERTGTASAVPVPAETPYRGLVYAFSVPNGVIYVRRNGRTAWCGCESSSLLR